MNPTENPERDDHKPPGPTNFFFLGGPMNGEEKEIPDEQMCEDGEWISLNTLKWEGAPARSAYQRAGNKLIFDQAMSDRHSAKVNLDRVPPPEPQEEKRIITDDFI